jgi:hypothetical protein
MKRSELEHVIRAAGAIADDTEIVVVGSQSVLGQFPNAPEALLASAEADLVSGAIARRAAISSTLASGKDRNFINSSAITHRA